MSIHLQKEHRENGKNEMLLPLLHFPGF